MLWGIQKLKNSTGRHVLMDCLLTAITQQEAVKNRRLDKQNYQQVINCRF